MHRPVRELSKDDQRRFVVPITVLQPNLPHFGSDKYSLVKNECGMFSTHFIGYRAEEGVPYIWLHIICRATGPI